MLNLKPAYDAPLSLSLSLSLSLWVRLASPSSSSSICCTIFCLLAPSRAEPRHDGSYCRSRQVFRIGNWPYPVITKVYSCVVSAWCWKGYTHTHTRTHAYTRTHIHTREREKRETQFRLHCRPWGFILILCYLFVLCRLIWLPLCKCFFCDVTQMCHPWESRPRRSWSLRHR